MGINKLVTVHNLATNDEMQFSCALPRSYMVAYAYAESTNQLTHLFNLRKPDEACVSEEAVRRAFPIQEGQVSIACGDWATLKQA